MGYADRSKLKHAVQDVLKGVEDWRVVSWLVDDMINHKPSDLAEILEIREDKLTKKYNHAKKMREYNQATMPPQKTKKQTHSHDDR